MSPNRPWRIVFMGTPAFAVPALRELAHNPAYEITLVITQPDRPAGRGRQMKPSAVKEAALELGLPIWQPESVNQPQVVAQLVGLAPEIIVVAAFGQLLRSPVLELPPHGCLNLHASLLPRYRGAAPIPAAILNGDAITGVTLMLMDAGLDTGPIIAQAQEPIHPDDTTSTLTSRLAELAARLLKEALPLWLRNELPAVPQEQAEATYCRPLKPADGHLNWNAPAVVIDRQVRAYQPWPGAYTDWSGRQLKILAGRPLPGWRGQAAPGTVLKLPEGFAVATGEGAFLLTEIQLAGKRVMPVEAFVRGQRGFVGAVLGQNAG